MPARDLTKLPEGALARGRFRLQRPDEVAQTFARLRELHPDAHCELDHVDPFQLLCATVLSAQTTDVNVNRVTPTLFAKYPDAAALAAANPSDVERIVGSLGFFRQKTRSLLGLAQKLVADHGGEVPRTLEELVKLPGVGRKTANVVLGVAFGAPEGVVVDTHVQRISQRLGWTRNKEPEKIEQDLCKLLPRENWDLTGHLLIFHGRRICFAIKPNCEGCGLNALCPSAFRGEKVGRKPARERGRKPARERGRKTARERPRKPARGPRKAGRAVGASGKGRQGSRTTKRSSRG
jgi:endonuclease-3